MIILKQSPLLSETFQAKIQDKISDKKQEIKESLGGGFFGEIGATFAQFKQIHNQFKGNLGENFLSFLLMSFPDSWVMFKNALIPIKSKKVTEIDLLIIGNGGVFLVEVKTWKGSFSAYEDKWKRREGMKWIPVENSPTSQSLYHRKMFEQFIMPQVSGFPEDFIFAPVVFPVAKWIGTTNCSVPVLQGFPELAQMLQKSPECLTNEQVSIISKLVENCELLDSPEKSSKPSPKPKPILNYAQDSGKSYSQPKPILNSTQDSGKSYSQPKSILDSTQNSQKHSPKSKPVLDSTQDSQKHSPKSKPILRKRTH
ncbi:nuclease-related domain-containing protein [Okeania sp.]|uniref:nuclease-related domain-containing protein n=1 Tax=Okeania sp. TaxID=3100323 RepID=UPI002B4AB1F5|nr:nuclease-related domain-containing protein [Okeania sp.]MEB3339898.1 nuclease-related domain-containing protein [Okeania sp.]